MLLSVGDANRRMTNEGANATVEDILILLYRIAHFLRKISYKHNQYL